MLGRVLRDIRIYRVGCRAQGLTNMIWVLGQCGIAPNIFPVH